MQATSDADCNRWAALPGHRGRQQLHSLNVDNACVRRMTRACHADRGPHIILPESGKSNAMQMAPTSPRRQSAAATDAGTRLGQRCRPAVYAALHTTSPTHPASPRQCPKDNGWDARTHRAVLWERGVFLTSLKGRHSTWSRTGPSGAFSVRLDRIAAWCCRRWTAATGLAIEGHGGWGSSSGEGGESV